MAGGPAEAVEPGALNEPQRGLRRALHQTIAKVSDDVGRRYTFNTAIAAVMELMNRVGRYPVETAADRSVVQETLDAVVLLLSPIVPHICHRLWHDLGHTSAVVDESWPLADMAACEAETLQIVVQVNGKLRARMSVGVDIEGEELKSLALAEPNVQRFIADKEIRKVVVVPGKLVNVVV